MLPPPQMRVPSPGPPTPPPPLPAIPAVETVWPSLGGCGPHGWAPPDKVAIEPPLPPASMRVGSTVPPRSRLGMALPVAVVTVLGLSLGGLWLARRARSEPDSSAPAPATKIVAASAATTLRATDDHPAPTASTGSSIAEIPATTSLRLVTVAPRPTTTSTSVAQAAASPPAGNVTVSRFTEAGRRLVNSSAAAADATTGHLRGTARYPIDDVLYDMGVDVVFDTVEREVEVTIDLRDYVDAAGSGDAIDTTLTIRSFRDGHFLRLGFLPQVHDKWFFSKDWSTIKKLLDGMDLPYIDVVGSPVPYIHVRGTVLLDDGVSEADGQITRFAVTLTAESVRADEASTLGDQATVAELLGEEGSIDTVMWLGPDDRVVQYHQTLTGPAGVPRTVEMVVYQFGDAVMIARPPGELTLPAD